MVRKRALRKAKLKKPSPQKPLTVDPTPEEIWGTDTTIRLAETIRMEREQPENKHCYRPSTIRECSTRMLPGGRGVLRGQG